MCKEVSISTRNELKRSYQKRYVKTKSRKEKSRILDEFIEAFGYQISKSLQSHMSMGYQH
jgi:hypothetical protein